MKRGEVWTVAGSGDYAGKPRPALILQDDSFSATQSVTICPFTTDPTDAPLVRVPVAPSSANGLREPSRLMIDKLTTVQRSRLGERLGVVDEAVLVQVARAVVVFLGIAGSPASAPQA
ncbi:MAG: type II toxin-antitoxin system PemK/MazF family toxin [Devosia sp.]|nr:type II toxin-antitoxin system PemK/MazF family toxin [Devosia sp.]